MGFDPSEPRVPAGGTAGGQWGAPAAAPKKKTSAAKSKTAPAKTKAPAKAPAKGKAPARGKTPPGTARNAAAAKVQQNPKAQDLYGKLLQAPPGQRGAYAKGLSSDDLKLLTQMVYSSRTSDPTVVAARMAVAGEMSRRGLDIKQYGALGGGLPAGRAATLQKVVARKVATKTAPRPAARPVARAVAKPAAKPVAKAPVAASPSSAGRFRPM